MQPTFDPLIDGEQESVAKVWLKRGLIALVVLLVLALVGYGIKKLMTGSSPQKKQITTIKLLPDTPPPPPPPPPKEPPKEQPKEQPKEIKVEQPKPAETPPAENLKMEGAAGDGPSPFAAGAVTNDYKGGDVNTIGGGPNKQQFAWYTGLIKDQIEDAMAKDPTLANGAYKVIVNIWVGANGKILRHELVGSSGKSEIDVLVNKALDSMPALAEPPPGDMPQPVKLKVTARSIS
ncbi:MAG: TonB C-terminal domain-containing protein [Methylophilus sp.]|nr:TonB C-terminal domain-containing protein [Methylophilus sp.]